VGYRDPETGKHYVFLTSHFTLSAKTIAEIYKERWQIEIFFRLIKQTLRLKSFVGNSENAVLSQVYVAMIVHLLLAYLKFRSKIGWSLQEMLQLLQLNVFKRTELEAFFKPPDKMSKINESYPLLAMAS
jgi:putative transposase